MEPAMMKMLAGAAAGAFALCLLPLAAQAAPPAPGQDPVEWCLLEGGEEVEQPEGSAIRACCAADGCMICDANWQDCTFEPTYGGRGAAAGIDGLGGPDTVGPAGPGSRQQLLATPLLQIR
jgi:hypothetical protein